MFKTKNILIVTFTISAMLYSSACGNTAKGSNSKLVQYPEGYQNWTHVKSMIIQEKHPLYKPFGGIHHIYANPKALKAIKKGAGVYPDGSVLIFDLLEAEEKDNTIVEGSRKVLGVMEKDSKRFANTGGWGFEGFKKNSKVRLVKNPKPDCFSCHQAKKQTDYVFSQYKR